MKSKKQREKSIEVTVGTILIFIIMVITYRVLHDLIENYGFTLELTLLYMLIIGFSFLVIRFIVRIFEYKYDYKEVTDDDIGLYYEPGSDEPKYNVPDDFD